LGAGLGNAAAQSLIDMINRATGGQAPATAKDQIVSDAKNGAEGAAYQLGGDGLSFLAHPITSVAEGWLKPVLEKSGVNIDLGKTLADFQNKVMPQYRAKGLQSFSEDAAQRLLPDVRAAIAERQLPYQDAAMNPSLHAAGGGDAVPFSGADTAGGKLIRDMRFKIGTDDPAAFKAVGGTGATGYDGPLLNPQTYTASPAQDISGQMLPAADANALKQDLYRNTNYQKGMGPNPNVPMLLNDAQKQFAGLLRGDIHQAVPGAALPDQIMSNMYKVPDLLQSLAQLIPGGKAVAKVGGAAENKLVQPGLSALSKLFKFGPAAGAWWNSGNNN
jgi:hypothetical protein